ncbi:hypothetical protein BDM02DRAFT_3125535 [Thelephora ganbajun]|uniref:Uncharacterized protein n=1 Tax=Thelephora ganbajun TaxID=370292 RepID=A0ACB6ZVU0_THEGA|nr:hypothetical protein BDM02DRAFT_3125535 [Thelephora ganbajun]
MADSVSSLTPSQAAALEQLQAITNGGDPDVAIGVLASVDWDVQRATEMIFDGHSQPTPHRKKTSTQIETFEMDDSEQGLLLGSAGAGSGSNRRPPNQPTSILSRRTIYTLLTFPFGVLSSIFRFIFGVLHIPLPRSFATLNFLTARGPSATHRQLPEDPKSITDRWVRALEEETGAVCISRSRNEAAATGVAGPSTASTSTLRSRGDTTTGLVLPDFFLGSYEEAMRTCQRELKIGCIILVSDEHQDAAKFKRVAPVLTAEFRTTLTDPPFVTFLQSNDFITWGGDIRDKEAWSTAHKLHATTYPFVAFAALQPQRTPASGTSSSSSPVMTILSRHAGIEATTTDKLLAHLADALIPRVKPFLDRLKTEERRREQERFMRAEQDRAYREAMNRDKARIERKIREEREAQRRAEEERVAEEKRLKAEEEERNRKEEWGRRRMEWRRYLRWLSKTNPTPSADLRIGIRMPDGTRGIKIFSPRDSLTALYGFVDSHFIPSELPAGEDPTSPPSSSLRGETAVHEEISGSSLSPEQWWKFRLATSYPRREISWQPSGTVGGTSGLENGVQLVVELVRDDDSKKSQKSLESKSNLAASTNTSEAGGDSTDEYDTESDGE